MKSESLGFEESSEYGVAELSESQSVLAFPYSLKPIAFFISFSPFARFPFSPRWG